MKKQQIFYLLKRYPYIADAIFSSRSVAGFSISRRKEQITIDSSVTKVISLFELAYSTETNKFTKEIIRSSVIEGNTDLESFHTASNCQDLIEKNTHIFINFFLKYVLIFHFNYGIMNPYIKNVEKRFSR